MGNIVDSFTWRILLYDLELRVPQSSQRAAIGHSAIREFRKPMKANDELWKKQLNSELFPNIYASALPQEFEPSRDRHRHVSQRSRVHGNDGKLNE